MTPNKIKTFPLRMDQYFHEEIQKALEKSVIKTKHDYIVKAIVEKIERDSHKAV
ncbi:hypothetical protein [Paenibacillus sp. XY044]|uniref:hypothetical protein n=1 Tax=Paenibacillus sp. XY044 TaxID=2026089 RepID=UPI0015C644EB|nr:hypothetical protein [Paenibacillus sp. XY044]